MNAKRRDGAGRVAALAAAGLLLLTAAGAAARADEGGWSIERFDVVIGVARDGTLDVTETIAARFDEPRHGIYREIPVRYEVNGQLYDLRFHYLGTTDTAGAVRLSQVSDVANLVRVKIGDPDRTLTGPQAYVIRYRLARAVLHEGEHAVLRWNATGTEWRVPIGGASVTVHLPEPLDDAHVQYDAWTGRYGSKQKDFRKSRTGPQSVRFETGALAAGEGITVEVAMPASAVVAPSLKARLRWWLADNFAFGLIPLGLFACFGLWYARGRDEPGTGTQVVHYEPPEGLGPAEVGTLVDEKVDLRDISSVLIDLAVRGYVTIEEVRKPGALWGSSSDYAFKKRKEPDGLKPYERVVHESLFADGDRVMLSDLKNRFYTHLQEVRTKLYKDLAEQGYFAGSPESVRLAYTALGLVVSALALGLTALVQIRIHGRMFVLPLVVTGLALAVMAVVTGRAMPRRTRKGRLAWERVRGLEEYIRRAEVDDLKAQERQSVFERLLPYATAFHLTTRWATAFEGLYTQPPDWYRTDHDGPFTMAYFGSSVDRSVTAMNATLPSQPRSEGSSGWSSGGFSGGGSSGGGFGGGGGGSW